MPFAVFWIKTQAAIAGSSSDDGYWLYYGYSSATNPPVDENNVYLFFDGFETWSGWTQYGTGAISQASAQSYQGTYSLYKAGSGDPNGGYKDMSITVDYPMIMEAWIRRTDLSGANADRIGVVDGSGNGYGAPCQKARR